MMSMFECRHTSVSCTKVCDNACYSLHSFCMHVTLIKVVNSQQQLARCCLWLSVCVAMFVCYYVCNIVTISVRKQHCGKKL